MRTVTFVASIAIVSCRTNVYVTGQPDAGVDASSGSADSGFGSDGSSNGSDGGSCVTPLCNGACCASNESCYPNASTGKMFCAEQCATDFKQTSTCGGSTSCCSPLTVPTGSDGGAEWSGKALCLPAAPGGACLCTTTAECSGGACTPALGYYTCQPNDGTVLHGCGTGCGTCHDCVTDCNGNSYCAWSEQGCSTPCATPFCVVAKPPGCVSTSSTTGSCVNDCMLCATAGADGGACP
jgi:hypothetical protein